MPWQEDEATGEEWYEGARLGQALSQASPGAIVTVEVHFEVLQRYDDDPEYGAWLPFYGHGISAETLLANIRRSSAARWFEAEAAGRENVQSAALPTRYRLFFLEGYVPHRDTFGKKH